ncbi:hypothetical protein G6L37_06720 [Agrobacterium rubi]|nr:hypothetical protein [Agrobacterium rubi]NTF25057.1 hypothetical protein [Agrobacterium rubi]
MKYDQYEIKKVEHMKSLSEETECFSLELFVQGKKFAHVSNRGNGGCHEVHPYAPFTWDDITRVTEEMKDDKFLVHIDFEEFDTGVSTLLALWSTSKQLTRDCKKKAVFLDEGNLYTNGYKNKAAPDQRLFDLIQKQHPSAVILNGMDVVEASKLVLIEDRKKFDAMYGDALNAKKN